MSVKKYLKIDSEKGYLDNKDDINYFVTNQLRKVAFDRMLGDFDENGLYVINAKIVEELIRMPKVIVEMVEEADLIRSKVKADSFFHFILTVEDNKASFKLLEKMHYQSNKDFDSGVYSNINEYILDEVKVPDKDFDRNALYQKYNISTENDGDVLSIFDMDELSLALYYNIVEKLKINYLVKNQLLLKEKELEGVEADYFEEVLEILDEFGDFGSKVIASTQEELAEKHNFMLISRPFFQHTVNEVLDSYIEMFVQDLSPEQREQFLIKLREAKSSYYQHFKTLVPIEIVEKAGIRFDGNQVVQETIIGELSQEITTKGYTSSDVRKIVINEDELQLSISKIKEEATENEEICKRNNANGRDITKDRKHAKEFFNMLEKKYEANMLGPTASLISAATEKRVEAEKSAEKSSTAEKPKEQSTEKSKSASTDNAKKTDKGVSVKEKPKKEKSANSGAQNGLKKKEQEKVKESSSSSSGGSGGSSGGGSNLIAESAKAKAKEDAEKQRENENAEIESTDFDTVAEEAIIGIKVREGIKSAEQENEATSGFNLR